MGQVRAAAVASGAPLAREPRRQVYRDGMEPPRPVADATATPGGGAGTRRGDYLLVIEGDRSWAVPLPASGELVIGRDPQVALPLSDALVSRTHAQLLLVPEGIRLTDLGSRHGTLLNGEPVTTPRLVGSGDVITVGEAVLVLRSHAVEARHVVDRRAWSHRLGDEAARARQFHRELAVLVIRTDRDAAGLVLAVADQLRPSDAVAAIGDGLVGVVLPEVGLDDAIGVARTLHDEAARSGARLAVGVALCPDDGVDADALTAAARTVAVGAAPGQTVVVRDAAPDLEVGKHRVVVADPAMLRIYELARRLARSSLPVLVQGETGCGKELAAAAVHAWSPRVDRPFVSINCAAIAETLAESELFGHARGSFSGALADKVGQLEAASGGTLFLDEIGELSLPVQAKLLRVLETGELTRVGEVTPRTTDIRLVAATNRDLDAEVTAGRFRRDLFFRLGSARLTLPPLRDRPRDLGALARRLLADAAVAAGRARLEISVEAMHTLHLHDWPGNVRELKNAIEYAATAAPDDAHEIELWHLPPPIAAAGRARAADRGFAAGSAGAATPTPGRLGEPPRPGLRPIADEVRELERARMVAALRATGGVQNRAAELIEMPQRTFATKLKRYAILPEDWGGP